MSINPSLERLQPHKLRSGEEANAAVSKALPGFRCANMYRALGKITVILAVRALALARCLLDVALVIGLVIGPVVAAWWTRSAIWPALIVLFVAAVLPFVPPTRARWLTLAIMALVALGYLVFLGAMLTPIVTQIG